MKKWWLLLMVPAVMSVQAQQHSLSSASLPSINLPSNSLAEASLSTLNLSDLSLSELEYPEHELSNAVASWAIAGGERMACFNGGQTPAAGRDAVRIFDGGWDQVKFEPQRAIEYINLYQYYAATTDSSYRCLN